MVFTKSYRLILLLACVALLSVWTLSGCGGGTTATNGTSGPRSWTVMVYQNGDNNLEDELIRDFLEMESVGSTSQVAVVAQLDTYAGETNRYYVVRSSSSSVITSPVVMALGEQDMGDPATLSSFISWAQSNYPADHYMLVLSSHAGGWRMAHPLRGVSVDDTSDSFLTLPQLRTALAQAGLKLDIIGFDACLMGMLEVGYEVRQWADYMVASEANVPGYGWPYDIILADLTTHPTLTPADVATAVVIRYNDSYQSYTRKATTMSAVNLSRIAQAAAACDTLASRLLALQGGISTLASVRDGQDASGDYRVEAYDWTDYRDLYELASVLRNDSSDANVRSACDQIMQAVNSAVIANLVTGTEYTDSHGLSVYLPTPSSFSSAYTALSFANTYQWDELLTQAVGGAPAEQRVNQSFRVGITWIGDCDVDLYVAEERNGEVEGVYYAYDGPTTPNGYFGVDSYFSGESEEQFQSLSEIQPGTYWFATAYALDGPSTTATNVTMGIQYSGSSLSYNSYTATGQQMTADASRDLWLVGYYDTADAQFHEALSIGELKDIWGKIQTAIGAARPSAK